MSIKTKILAAAAVVSLAAPAAAFAHDYQGYNHQGYDHQGYDHQGYDHQGYDRGVSYGFRHEDAYRHGFARDYRTRWDGPAWRHEHHGWRGYGWSYGDYRR